MSNIQEVVLMTTGGTIEKQYNEFDGSLKNRGSIIKTKLESKLRLPYTKLQVLSLMDKDSLQMDDNDRSFICNAVKNQLDKNLPIVVLHGTDTMAHTAEFCYKALGEVQVPIIFTGAMKPLGFDDSDALQNVTEALLATKLLSPGIYISFHSEIFEVPHVRKNLDRGTFERV